MLAQLQLRVHLTMLRACACVFVLSSKKQEIDQRTAHTSLRFEELQEKMLAVVKDRVEQERMEVKERTQKETKEIEEDMRETQEAREFETESKGERVRVVEREQERESEREREQQESQRENETEREIEREGEIKRD